MTTTEKIDAALDSVFKAGGLTIKYSSDQAIDNMRLAMRKIMMDSYIQGSNDTHQTMKGKPDE